jgi:hypothetical protein
MVYKGQKGRQKWGAQSSSKSQTVKIFLTPCNFPKETKENKKKERVQPTEYVHGREIKKYNKEEEEEEEEEDKNLVMNY